MSYLYSATQSPLIPDVSCGPERSIVFKNSSVSNDFNLGGPCKVKNYSDNELWIVIPIMVTHVLHGKLVLYFIYSWGKVCRPSTHLYFTFKYFVAFAKDFSLLDFEMWVFFVFYLGLYSFTIFCSRYRQLIIVILAIISVIIDQSDTSNNVP